MSTQPKQVIGYGLLIIGYLLLTVVIVSCADDEPEQNDGPVLVTVTPVPIDFTAHHQVMRPDFASEVDQVVAQGATFYQIELVLHADSLNASTQPFLTGQVEVHYTNTESVLLNQIYFRLFPNTPSFGGRMHIIGATVNQQSVQPTFLAQDSTLGVPLMQPLELGQAVDIRLRYEATLPTSINAGYGLYTYANDIISLAGFYPLIPVFDADGWHVAPSPSYGDVTYSDVSLYDVTITAPADMVIVSSGSILGQLQNNDGTQTIQAFSGPMRDFQVVMSRQYHHLSQEIDGIKINSYYPADAQNQAKGELALQVASQSLQTFNRLFGPYPYREFDIVAVPMDDKVGGVEYPGLIAMAERYYYTDDDFMEFVLAHEVAHQWWYGLVGSNQVAHPWLDESLTNYTAIQYYEDYYGSERGQVMIERMFTAAYQQLRLIQSNRPVLGSVSDFPENLYQAVVYGKGPLFFDAVRGQVGDEAYFASLQTYAQRYRYGIAQPDDLLAIFQEISGQDVQDLYQQWIVRK